MPTCLGEFPIEPHTDIYAVCDIVKTWMRQLPDSVWPTDQYFETMEAASTLNIALTRSYSLTFLLKQRSKTLMRV